MTKQPWMKFYPADWRADAALRTCSPAARGMWIEMLCIMHDASPRGVLAINGRPVTDAQLSVLSGIPARDIVRLTDELEGAGVFSRAADGAIYSRRIMRDEDRASRDKANGTRGGNPRLKAGVNPPDNPPHNRSDNRGDKAQKLEAREEPSQEGELDEGSKVVSLGRGRRDA